MKIIILAISNWVIENLPIPVLCEATVVCEARVVCVARVKVTVTPAIFRKAKATVSVAIVSVAIVSVAIVSVATVHEVIVDEVPLTAVTVLLCDHLQKSTLKSAPKKPLELS